MFHSETISRVIHADRVRDLERAARERRLLDAGRDNHVASDPASVARVAPASKRPARGDSAGLPA